MKKPFFFLWVILLTFTISACGSQVTSIITSQPAASDIYTSVAQTVLSQITSAAKVTPTPRLQETAIQNVDAGQETSIPEPTQVPTPTSTVICDNSAFISDVTYPDGATVAPGEAFIKTWKLQNSGACSWIKNTYVLAYVSGSSMSGSTTPLKSTVGMWGKTDVSVALVAPQKAGPHTGYWRLKNASGIWFGSSVYVKIVVEGDAKTVTSTPEEGKATSTKTPKPTRTPTPE